MPDDPVSDAPASEQAVESVSLREAARRLGHDREHPLSVQTVQNWLKKGRLAGAKEPKPNGQERWVVHLPSDPSDLDRLRAQLRRPDAPSSVVFPGPAAFAVADPRDDEIRFLREELAARRDEVRARDQLVMSLTEALARVSEPKALPAPSRPWYWWISPWREW